MKESKIIFCGDVVCTQWDIDNNINFEEWFECLRDYFGTAELVVSNIETPLAGEERRYTFEPYCFNTPKEIGIAMKNAGINFVSTVNNHCLDRGVDGLRQTIRNLDDIGLEHTGTFTTGDEKKYSIIEMANGIKIGIYATTYGTNAHVNKCWLKSSQKKLVNLIQEQELHNLFARFCVQKLKRRSRVLIHERVEGSRRIKKHVAKDVGDMINNCDTSIVLLHDGSQFELPPLKRKLDNIAFFKKLGVDLVVTNHEHIVTGHLKDDRFFATYSLGDLTGAAGLKVPRNHGKKAEYSIALNVYIDENADKKYTFTIIKRVLENGCYKPKLLFDLYKEAATVEEKRKYYWQNIKIYNNFMGKRYTKLEVKKEYCIDS